MKSIQDIEWDNCTTDDKSVDVAIKTSFSPVKVFPLIPNVIAPHGDPQWQSSAVGRT